MRMLDGDFGFADVMGIGEAPSLMLAVFAEVVCSSFLVLGLFTRFSLVPLIITMLVAVFYIHRRRPFCKARVRTVVLDPLCNALSDRTWKIFVGR